MQRSLVILFFVSLFWSCKESAVCEDDLNLKPEYGNVEKCQEQLDIDKDFLKECKQQFKNNKEASEYFAKKGFEYFSNKDINTAIKRFNQAWLLDNENMRAYWGFGIVTGSNKDYANSIKYFNKAIFLSGDNAKLLKDASTSYFQYSFLRKDTTYINKGIDLIKKSLSIAPGDPHAYVELTKAYFYLKNGDSASKYLRIVDSYDPQLIENDLRTSIRMTYSKQLIPVSSPAYPY